MNIHVPLRVLQAAKWGASLISAGVVGVGLRVATDPLQNHVHRTYPIDKHVEIYRRDKWALFSPYTYVGGISLRGQCCMECGFVSEIEHDSKKSAESIGYQVCTHHPWTLTSNIEKLYQDLRKPNDE